MKKLLKSAIIIAGAALLIAGCAKEKVKGPDAYPADALAEVEFSVATEDAATKAVADGDGAAAKINHWVMEVLDSDGDIFLRKDEDGTTGEVTHTFNVKLVKGQTYNVLFWADTKGTYKTDSLTKVKLISDDDLYEGNKDSRDAFSAVESSFTVTGAAQKSVTLKRPFGQLNIIFTDLDTLYKSMGQNLTEYLKFKPCSLQVGVSVPTCFNVNTQTASGTDHMTISASSDYLDNYNTHGLEETIFMDYFFASAGSKDIVDIDFAFYSKGQAIQHAFTSVPFQRNYRTNIKGDLMTAGATWNVTIDPTWNTPDFDVPYFVTSSIQDAKTYISTAGSASDTIAAKVVKIQEGSVQASDVKTDEVEGLKVVEFVLKKTSPSDVSFQLPAVGDNADAWYVTHESGYPTSNVSVDAPEGTKVIIDAPNSHVEVTGTSYAQIIASTNSNTLVIPKGCAVDSLVVKEGGLEIHGTVNKVKVLGTTSNVFVRACEGLSQTVYDVLKDYIAEGYEGMAQCSMPVTYDIVLTSEKWSDYAAKSFAQLNATAKTINILTEAEFALFANNVNAGTTYEGWTITLGNALDMSDHKWTPIGRQDVGNQVFKGTFDGKNMPIKNLVVYSKDRKGNGVFGKVYSPCVLKNINIVDAVVTAEGTNTYTGGLVGHGYATIENCSFQGTVNGGNQMGGIAASGGFTIKNCTFDGTINGKYWGIGGIIGNCQDGGEISGNTATGSIVGVLAESNDPFIGGGIIGCAIYATTPVKNNYSAMNITFNGEAQKDFPIAGVYNIDKPGTGTTDFSNLLTKVADNTWDKSIFTEDEYVFLYNNDAPASTGYMLNYGTTSTKIVVAMIGDTAYESINAALAAVQEGETIILGKVKDTPASIGAIANVSGKTFTIEGADRQMSIFVCGNGTDCGSDGFCDYRLEGANVTFKNITISQYKGTEAWLQGFARVGDLTFYDCNFSKGAAAYWGNNCKIEDCVFDQTSAYEYPVYTWGCAAMSLKYCTFNTQGKAIKMYGAGTCTLNVENCTFNSNGQHSGANKPAITINTLEYTTDYTVNITNCTQNGFVAGATGSAMFGSDLLKEVQGNLKVYENGELKWDGKAIPAGAVDLGLSVCWADHNIGATNPQDYGTYFAWGDITGQTWNSGWSGAGFADYPSYEIDSNNLKPAYDAAVQNWGDPWRMPTKAEFEELKNNCTATKTSIGGVNGVRFTSNKEGYTDKSIFIPYGGSSNLNGDSIEDVGSGGYCWSSTFAGNKDSYYFSISDQAMDDYWRKTAMSVRPVCPANK